MTLKAELPVFPEVGIYPSEPKNQNTPPPWPTNFGKYPPWKFWSFPLPDSYLARNKRMEIIFYQLNIFNNFYTIRDIIRHGQGSPILGGRSGASSLISADFSYGVRESMLLESFIYLNKLFYNSVISMIFNIIMNK